MNSRKRKIIFFDSQAPEEPNIVLNVDPLRQCNISKKRKQNIVERVIDENFEVENTSDNSDNGGENSCEIFEEDQECEIIPEDLHSELPLEVIEVTQNEEGEKDDMIEDIINYDDLVHIQNQLLTNNGETQNEDDNVIHLICEEVDASREIQLQNEVLETRTSNVNIFEINSENVETISRDENQLLESKFLQTDTSTENTIAIECENFVDIKQEFVESREIENENFVIFQQYVESVGGGNFVVQEEDENNGNCSTYLESEGGVNFVVQEEGRNEGNCSTFLESGEVGNFVIQEEVGSEDGNEGKCSNENSMFDTSYEPEVSVNEEEDKCEGEFVLQYDNDADECLSNLPEETIIGSDDESFQFQEHFLLRNDSQEVSNESQHSTSKSVTEKKKKKAKKTEETEDPDWKSTPISRNKQELSRSVIDRPFLYYKQKKNAKPGVFVEQTRVKTLQRFVRIKCPICPKEFMDRIHYNLHIKIIHKIDVDMQPTNNKPQKTTIVCRKCKKIFHHADGYKLHVEHVHRRKVNTSVPQLFKCLSCNRTFVLAENLQRHIKCCEKLKELRCRQEAQEILGPSASVADVKTDKFPCSFCKSVLKTARTLSDHVQFQHKTPKPQDKKPVPLRLFSVNTTADPVAHAATLTEDQTKIKTEILEAMDSADHFLVSSESPATADKSTSIDQVNQSSSSYTSVLTNSDRTCTLSSRQRQRVSYKETSDSDSCDSY